MPNEPDSVNVEFIAGQKLLCRVIAAEPGGYAVSMTPGNKKGFLPTDKTLEVGQEIEAKFVCSVGGRGLLMM